MAEEIRLPVVGVKFSKEGIPRVVEYEFVVEERTGGKVVFASLGPDDPDYSSISLDNLEKIVEETKTGFTGFFSSAKTEADGWWAEVGYLDRTGSLFFHGQQLKDFLYRWVQADEEKILNDRIIREAHEFVEQWDRAETAAEMIAAKREIYSLIDPDADDNRILEMLEERAMKIQNLGIEIDPAKFSHND